MEKQRRQCRVGSLDGGAISWCEGGQQLDRGGWNARTAEGGELSFEAERQKAERASGGGVRLVFHSPVTEEM